MKRTNTSYLTKLTIAILTLTVMLILGQNIYGQTAVLNNSLLHNYDLSKNTIQEFSSKHYSNTIYMKWITKSTPEDCIFLIQRSYNNSDFQTIGVKKQYGSDVEIDLMYCFTDNKFDVSQQSVYYRIVCTTELGSDVERSDVTVIKNSKYSESQQITSIE